MNIRNKISKIRIVVQLSYLCVFLAAILSHNIVFWFITITAFLCGPIFCGWMCFLGTYQDALRNLGKIIYKKPIELSDKVHNSLKYSRFILFAGTLTIGGWFLLPGKTWHDFSSLLKGGHIVGITLYFIIALGIASIFSRRIFCRYFCTFGAKLGLFSLFRAVTINRNDSCISCGKCHKECLMGIEVDKINSLVNPNCINCLKCVEVCPKNSLNIGIRNYLKP